MTFLSDSEPSNVTAHSASSTAPYRARRERVIATMRAAGGGVAVIPTAPEVLRNADVEHAYRHDSYFYYLTGFAEPGAWLVLDARTEHATSTLFCRSKDLDQEIWNGFRFGPEAAREQFGFDAAYPLDALDATLPVLLSNAPAIYCPLGTSAEFDATLRGWLDGVRARRRAGISVPPALVDVRVTLDEMRVIKDDHELDIMRRAAQISAQAHRRAMQATRPGMHEYELEAELLYEFRRRGAQAPAYGSIVAAGVNACTLHYPAGNARARDGDLILIDAACELDGYAADITRTFPANGRYSHAQRELYEIVLAAQAAAIEATHAGARYDAPHQAATRVLAQGLRDTGILDGNRLGSVEDIIAAGAHTRFTVHSTGHWIGMDVHDCGRYRELPARDAEATDAPAWRKLQPNMTLTIEPGLYIRAAEDVPQQYWGIGIRIEDDAIVTETGCELTTRDVPVEAEQIEALMRQR